MSAIRRRRRGGRPRFPLRPIVRERDPFPDDGICTRCGSTAWRIVESGYWRFTQAVFEPPCADEQGPFSPLLIAISDGWDDMSETGEDQFVMCLAGLDDKDGGLCGAEYAMPAEVDWQ